MLNGATVVGALGPNIDARNVAGREQVIRLVESAVSGPSAPTTVAPFSINMYEWQLR